METPVNEILHCPHCGSTDVDVLAWVNVNSCEYNGVLSEDPDAEDYWCNACEEHTVPVPLSALWDEFYAIPVDENGRITKSFLTFHPGTKRSVIWQWFMGQNPNGAIVDYINSFKNSRFNGKNQK